MEESIFYTCITYTKDLVAQALADEDVTVSVGGTTVGRNFEFLIRELPQSVTVSDAVTNALSAGKARGYYRCEFNIAFETWSKRKTLDKATSDVMRWVQLAFDAIALDKTLGGLVIHAEPYFDTGGTAQDTTNKLYTAAIDCGVHVKAEIIPAVKENQDGD